MLPSIQSLRRLVLDAHVPNSDWGPRSPQLVFSNSALPRILQHLTALTKLQLSCTDYTLDVQGHALEAVSALQHLQRLSIMVQKGLDYSILGRLPPSITALELSGDTGGVEDASADDLKGDWLNLKNAPFLQGLSSLQHLLLRDVLFNTSRFADLPTAPLTFLQLENVVGYPDEDGAALLAALNQLTGLKHLALGANFWECELAPEQFSALTAASGLTALHILGRSEQPLPEGALEHIFPEGRQLPELQLLRLDCRIKTEDEADDYYQGCMWPDDVCCIADCCPALQHLQLLRVVRPTADADWVHSMQQLPLSLSALSLAGSALRHEVAAAVARLTGLQSLVWTDSPIKQAGLQRLTALTGLTRLELARCSELPRRLCPAVGDYYMDPSIKRVIESSQEVSMCQC
jgi:hypothetical protein